MIDHVLAAVEILGYLGIPTGIVLLIRSSPKGPRP